MSIESNSIFKTDRRQGSVFQEMRSEEQDERLVSEVKSSSLKSIEGGLTKPLPHTSNRDYRQMVRDEAFTNCFPLGDRMLLGLKRAFCCRESDATFIDQLKISEQKHPPRISADFRDNVLTRRIIQLTVIESSRLELDPNVVHPFVRVHFVNRETGCYLQKSQDIESATYHNESGGVYNEGKWKSCENNLLLPVATTCADFRLEGSSRGLWNQKFYINEQAVKVLTPQTIILFELLDFNPQNLIDGKVDELSHDNLYRVGWAYLRPIGIGKKHIGVSKLQLYRYKLSTRKLPHDYIKSYIPAVYYQFLWSLHEKYQGYLTVDLGLCPRPSFVDAGYLSGPKTIFQRQKQDQAFLKKFAIQTETEHKQPVAKYQQLLSYYRVNQCKIPHTLVQKFPSDKAGCLRIAMTDDLLLACCSTQAHTVIKGFSLETLKHVFTLRGHRDIIYSISVSFDQKHFVTVGSDYSAKLWAIPRQTGDFISEKNSQSYLIAKCVHPSYVYSGSIFQVSMGKQLVVLTGCYDGLVRLWRVDTQGKIPPQSLQIQISSLDGVYPLCITTGEGYFIVGDSMGGLHIFDIQLGVKEADVCKKRATMNPKQLKDDPIYSIHILNKANIIVQCKDNVIRHFEISTGNPKVVRSYFGSQSENYLIRSAISPDKRYIMSGSEEGRPIMWEVSTGEIVTTDHLQLDIQGPIVDCCWSKKFNLIALSGFVQECPVFLYGHRMKETDPQIILALMQKRN